jgi:hypothetical protein
MTIARPAPNTPISRRFAPEGSRRCCKCRVAKPVVCFGSDRSRKEGISPRCLSCANLVNNQHQRTAKGKIARERWRQQPEVIERGREYDRERSYKHNIDHQQWQKTLRGRILNSLGKYRRELAKGNEVGGLTHERRRVIKLRIAEREAELRRIDMKGIS